MLDINWFSFFKTVFPKIKKENSWSGCLVGYFLILVFFLKITKKIPFNSCSINWSYILHSGWKTFPFEMIGSNGRLTANLIRLDL